VIVASASQTYKRNAFNNGFIVLECPELVDDLAAELKAQVAAGELTIRTPEDATVDFASGRIRYGGKDYGFAPLGQVPQSLVAAGGSEALIKQRLSRPA